MSGFKTAQRLKTASEHNLKDFEIRYVNQLALKSLILIFIFASNIYDIR